MLRKINGTYNASDWMRRATRRVGRQINGRRPGQLNAALRAALPGVKWFDREDKPLTAAQERARYQRRSMSERPGGSRDHASGRSPRSRP